MIDLHVVERLRGLHRFRATSLEHEGFTPKQSAFLLLVLVLEHSGVFVERQYCAFAGITHGQKTHDFLRRLTGSGLAREARPGALHRGRLYHVHHKRLYATIGEPDNRNRRTAPIGALAARLMLLDLVLDDPSRLWLGTSRDKRLYFTHLDTQSRLEDVELPHLRYGAGRDRVLRLFPDKFPIGAVTQDPDAHVFTYLVTQRNPMDFRAFLQRHHSLLCFGGPWVLRIALPGPFHGVESHFRRVVREELFAPMELSATQELQWYCEERVRRERTRHRRVTDGSRRPTVASARPGAPTFIASTNSAASLHSPVPSVACCSTSCSGARRVWSSCCSSGSTFIWHRCSVLRRSSQRDATKSDVACIASGSSSHIIGADGRTPARLHGVRCAVGEFGVSDCS